MIIQITEEKVESLAEHIEQGLKHLGKAMQCIEDFKNGESYGERYGERNWEEEYDAYDDDMRGMPGRRNMREAYGMRQGVRGTGRYSRYR